MRFTDLAGVRFGRLTAVAPAFSRDGGRYTYKWECLCECGTAKLVEASHLKSGAIKSCGCITRSRGGVTKHPLYGVWANMVSRCLNPDNKRFPDYGGRGVGVCSRWLSPENFIADMSPRPEGQTLERSDNNGHYSPENCRWATREEQASNKRNVPLHELGGERLSIAQWARRYGLPAETLRSRVRAGVSLVEALSAAPRKPGPPARSK